MFQNTDRVLRNIIEQIVLKFLKFRRERFWNVLGGHIYFQTLVTGVEIGLFELLHKEKSLTQQEIAEKLSIQIKPIKIILLGLVATKLLEKKRDHYSLSCISRRCFVANSPHNILSILKWQKYINYRAMFHLTESVRENRNVGLKEFNGNENTLYERLEHHPDLNKIFQDAMQDISKQSIPHFVKYLDVSGVKKITDVGGGNGTVIKALVEKNKNIIGTVFDLPSVKDLFERNISSNTNIKDRVLFEPGNCFKDPIPKTDMILFCHFFTIWSAEQSIELLKKCYTTLESGGKVVIFNMMQADNEEGPLSAALGSPYFLTIATGNGMMYCWKDYIQWVKNAGFSKIQKIKLPLDHGIIIATK